MRVKLSLSEVFLLLMLLLGAAVLVGPLLGVNVVHLINMFLGIA